MPLICTNRAILACDQSDTARRLRSEPICTLSRHLDYDNGILGGGARVKREWYWVFTVYVIIYAHYVLALFCTASRMYSYFLALSLWYSAAHNRDLYHLIDVTFADNTLLTLWFFAFISVISDLKSAFVKFDLPTRVYQINGECIGENINRWQQSNKSHKRRNENCQFVSYAFVRIIFQWQYQPTNFTYIEALFFFFSL